MSKLYVVIIILGLALLAIGGILFFGYNKKSQIAENTNTINSLSESSPVPGINLDSNYKDDSGLTFKYPGDATVTDITPNDNSYYTLLDIKRGEKSIRITIKDGDFKVPADASLVGAASLGKFSAKQYSYKSGGDEVLATVAVNQGIVYLVEGPKDNGSGEDLQNAIVGSVNFGTQDAATNSGSGSSETVDEGEEVIE
jgi:hypothetical protein